MDNIYDAFTYLGHWKTINSSLLEIGKQNNDYFLFPVNFCCPKFEIRITDFYQPEHISPSSIMPGDEGDDNVGERGPSDGEGEDVDGADSELDDFQIEGDEDEDEEMPDSSGLLLGQDEEELDEIDRPDVAALEAQETGMATENHGSDAGEGDVMIPAAKIKRPSSAWMIYINEQRDRMRREHPGMTIGEVAKALSAEYKALAPEVAEKYLELARKDKERYIEAMKNAPPVASGGINARGAGNEPIPPGELVFPLVSVFPFAPVLSTRLMLLFLGKD
jgi:hypothetical protein